MNSDTNADTTNLPDCVVNISKSSSSSVVAIIADSVVVDSNACLSCLPQSAGNVGLVVSIFGVVTVVEPKTTLCHQKALLKTYEGGPKFGRPKIDTFMEILEIFKIISPNFWSES